MDVSVYILQVSWSRAEESPSTRLRIQTKTSWTCHQSDHWQTQTHQSSELLFIRKHELFFYMSTLQCTSVNNHTLSCHQSSQRYTAVRKLITSVLTPSQQSACQHTHRCSCLQVVLWSAVLKIIRMCDRGCRYLYVNADKAEAFIHFLSFFLPAFKKQQLRVISPWLCVCVWVCLLIFHVQFIPYCEQDPTVIFDPLRCFVCILW